MKKLNVLGFKVTVKIQKIPDELNQDGQAFEDQIIIDPRAEDPFQVYIHEALHQLNDRIGIYRTTVDKDLEHIWIDMAASFFKDNIVTIWQAYQKLNKLKK